MRSVRKISGIDREKMQVFLAQFVPSEWCRFNFLSSYDIALQPKEIYDAIIELMKLSTQRSNLLG